MSEHRQECDCDKQGRSLSDECIYDEPCLVGNAPRESPRDEIRRLRKALTYYAEGRYPDGGEIAREALGLGVKSDRF